MRSIWRPLLGSVDPEKAAFLEAQSVYAPDILQLATLKPGNVPGLFRTNRTFKRDLAAWLPLQPWPAGVMDD